MFVGEIWGVQGGETYQVHHHQGEDGLIWRKKLISIWRKKQCWNTSYKNGWDTVQRKNIATFKLKDCHGM